MLDFCHGLAKCQQNLMRILLLLLLLGLSACSALPSKSTAATQNFRAEGLVGITTAQSVQSGNFNWQQTGARYSIEFYGPLGLGATYLDSDGQQVTLTLSNQEHTEARSAEVLMQKVLGWSLPVDGLQYWLRAEAVPNVPPLEVRNSKGQLVSLMQEGWQITYTWQDQVWPHKIVLVRPGIKVIIIINNFSS